MTIRHPINYPADLKAKAAADEAVLVTCDFFGRHAMQGSTTMQGTMTVEQAKEFEKLCFEFFRKRKPTTKN